MYNLSISEYLEFMLHPQISKKYIKNMKIDIIDSPNKKLMKQQFNQLMSYYSLFDLEELISLKSSQNSSLSIAIKKNLQFRIQHSLQPIWTMFIDVQYQYYHNLLQLPYFTIFDSIIHKDVIRTTQDLKMQPKLSNVLTAYARRNPTIGYCQGFNYIAHFFLQRHFDEEQTFWLMCHLFENILPPDYYNYLIGVLVDDKILTQILSIQLPDLKNHFEQLEIETSFFSIQLLVCCFTMHTKLADAIMDLLMIEGSKALLKAILTYLHLLTTKLMQQNDIASLLMLFEEFQQTFYDRSLFLSTYNKIYINNKLLAYVRQDYSAQITKTIQENNQKKRKLEELTQCNINKPICLQSLQIHRLAKNHQEFHILKVSSFCVIHDYEQTRSRASILDNQSEELLIFREPHICQSQIDLRKEISKQLYSQRNHITITQKTAGRARSPIKEMLLLPLQVFSIKEKSNIPNYKLERENNQSERNEMHKSSRSPQFNRYYAKKMSKKFRLNINQQNMLSQSKSIKFLNDLRECNDDIGLPTIQEQ